MSGGSAGRTGDAGTTGGVRVDSGGRAGAVVRDNSESILCTLDTRRALVVGAAAADCSSDTGGASAGDGRGRGDTRISRADRGRFRGDNGLTAPSLLGPFSVLAQAAAGAGGCVRGWRSHSRRTTDIRQADLASALSTGSTHLRRRAAPLPSRPAAAGSAVGRRPSRRSWALPAGRQPL